MECGQYEDYCVASIGTEDDCSVWAWTFFPDKGCCSETVDSIICPSGTTLDKDANFTNFDGIVTNCGEIENFCAYSIGTANDCSAYAWAYFPDQGCCPTTPTTTTGKIIKKTKKKDKIVHHISRHKMFFFFNSAKLSFICSF